MRSVLIARIKNMSFPLRSPSVHVQSVSSPRWKSTIILRDRTPSRGRDLLMGKLHKEMILAGNDAGGLDDRHLHLIKHLRYALLINQKSLFTQTVLIELPTTQPFRDSPKLPISRSICLSRHVNLNQEPIATHCTIIIHLPSAHTTL